MILIYIYIYIYIFIIWLLYNYSSTDKITPITVKCNHSSGSQSLKPLAKGLLAIFSWVIYNEYSYIQNFSLIIILKFIYIIIIIMMLILLLLSYKPIG